MRLSILSIFFLFVVSPGFIVSSHAQSCGGEWAVEERREYIAALQYQVQLSLYGAADAMNNGMDPSSYCIQGQRQLEEQYKVVCGTFKHGEGRMSSTIQGDWYQPGTSCEGGPYYLDVQYADLESLEQYAQGYERPEFLRALSGVEPGMQALDIPVQVSCGEVGGEDGVSCRSCYGTHCELGTVQNGVCMLNRYQSGGSTSSDDSTASGGDDPYDSDPYSGDDYQYGDDTIDDYMNGDYDTYMNMG